MITSTLTLALFTLIAIWLDANRSALTELSGGRVRALEGKVADEAMRWLERRREYGFVFRALSFTKSLK